MKPVIHVGIDVGSTTVKVAALSPYMKLLFGRYERHMSDIRHMAMVLLHELKEKFSGYRITASISGSGGMGLAKVMGLPFCQEILAESLVYLCLVEFLRCLRQCFMDDASRLVCMQRKAKYG